MLTWWGDIGSNARTNDSSVIGDVVGFSMIPGSDKVYNSKKGAWENNYNEAPNNAYLGWGVYVTNRVEGDSIKRKAAWSAAAHIGVVAGAVGGTEGAAAAVAAAADVGTASAGTGAVGGAHFRVHPTRRGLDTRPLSCSRPIGD